MLELQAPILEGLVNGRARHLVNEEDEDEEEESSSTTTSLTASPMPVTLGTRPHQLRFSERCRSRLLQRKFKAKVGGVGAATKAHHHRSKDVQRRSSAIARVWDTLATVRWSNSRNEDALIARLEQLRTAAGCTDDAGGEGGGGDAGGGWRNVALFI